MSRRFLGHSFELDDAAEQLERAGEWGLASDVRAGRCMSSSEARRAVSALEDAGRYDGIDYRVRDCDCEGSR